MSKSAIRKDCSSRAVAGWHSRVERSGSAASPPRQSVRAVFPHTAFLWTSSSAFTGELRQKCISSGLLVHTFRLMPQRPFVHIAYTSFGSCGYSNRFSCLAFWYNLHCNENTLSASLISPFFLLNKASCCSAPSFWWYLFLNFDWSSIFVSFIHSNAPSLLPLLPFRGSSLLWASPIPSTSLDRLSLGPPTFMRNLRATRNTILPRVVPIVLFADASNGVAGFIQSGRLTTTISVTGPN